MAWRRLAADRHDKESGVTGALMAAFSPQERANYLDKQATLLNDRSPLSRALV
jgi:hypothetical protein